MGPVLTIIRLELRKMARGKKLLVMLVILLGAAALAFAVRWYAPPPPGREGGWPMVYVMMMTFLFLQTLVLLIPLLFMTGLVRDEVEDGTLVYLFTRPVPKPLVFAAKFAAAALFASALTAGGMVLFHAAFTLSARQPEPEFEWGKRLAAFTAAGILGVIGYGSIFAFAGLVSRRAQVLGIAYGFVSEFVLSNVPAVIKKFTVMYYLRSVALGGMTEGTEEEAAPLLKAMEEAQLIDFSTPARAAITVFCAAAVFLAASMAAVTVLELPLQKNQEST